MKGFRTLLIREALAEAFTRFVGAVNGREAATKTLKDAQTDANLALVLLNEKDISAVRAEEILEDAQTEYESATAELTRALGGKAFDPVTGDLI